LVGGLSHLPVLASGVMLLRASAAVNADLPYDEVLRLTDAALRAGPASEQARSHLQARLSRRQTESSRFERLTDREAEVLAQLMRGQSAAEIARQRPVALATVRTQIASILSKLEVPSQAAALVLTSRACRDHRVLAAARLHQNY